MTTLPSDPPPLDALLAHRPWVRAVARRLARDDFAADDLEQDAWLAALRRPPAPGPGLAGWFDRVVRNRRHEEHRGAMRLAARERTVARREATASTAELVAEADAHRLVVNAVLALPGSYREAILLRYFEGLPPREIAAREGVAVETVRSRLKRAADLLRTELGAEGGDAWLGVVAPLLVGGTTVKITAKTAVVATLLVLLCGMVGLIALFQSLDIRDDAIARVASPPRAPGRVTKAAEPLPLPPVVVTSPAPAVRDAKPVVQPTSETLPSPQATVPDQTPDARPVAVDVPLSGESHGSPSLVDENLPAYEPVVSLSGSLTAIGSDTMLNIVTNWGAAFHALYPGVTVQVEARGSATAPPALVAGTSQLGPMSREMKADEVKSFEAKYGYKPTRLKTCLDALAVFVHKDNPLTSLTMQQVDSIFSSTRKAGGDAITTWGQLGLGEPFASSPITLYGRNSASGTSTYFKEKALLKGDFRDGVKEQPGSAGLVDVIGQDKFGIGYGGVGYRTSDVKVLGLALKEGGTVYSPSPGNVKAQVYPLGRYLNVYIDKAPGKPLSPEIREFFRFVYSKEGQEIVAKEGFLPLSERDASGERAKVQ